jgi:folate-binding protein YgfZ
VPRSSPGSGPVRLAHAFRSHAILAVEGADRAVFLQGQLTQEVRGLRPGESRLAAGLTPQGKLLYFGRLVAEAERFLLLLDPDAGAAALPHLARFAAFQRASVRDVSSERVVASLYGSDAGGVPVPAGAVRLPPWGELAAELVAPATAREELAALFGREGSTPLSEEDAEVLRVEAGRPRFGREATPANLPQEAGLAAAIAEDKGCYVGQEIVARIKTYGRVNRRLVGFRFPEGLLEPGTAFPSPEKPALELARVTSSVLSPRFGPIGLGLAFRDVPEGAALAPPPPARGSAVVSALPFASA